VFVATRGLALELLRNALFQLAVVEPRFVVGILATFCRIIGSYNHFGFG